MFVIERSALDTLLTELKKKDFSVIGPTVRDQAIVYDEIQSTRDLPEGWTDEQQPGHYRLKKRNDAALFGYVVGPTSWKKFLNPPRIKLWDAQKKGKAFVFSQDTAKPVKYAFLGVRACELQAIAIQDKVFLKGRYQDAVYKKNREGLFIIAVNCGQAASTCFCTSMNTGPRAGQGYDLALTEVIEDNKHYFVLDAGTPAGERFLKLIPHRNASPEELKKGEAATHNAAAQIKRRLETKDIKNLLYRNAEHPHWDQVASRCLSCANCTMACPTCFCSTVEDATDLTGDHAERWRMWDSCFNLEFTYIHGGNIRSSVKSRYRQWLTHKLAGWQDQFGSSGCVGCGRCISWCPVGIDMTQEVRSIRDEDVHSVQAKK